LEEESLELEDAMKDVKLSFLKTLDGDGHFEKGWEAPLQAQRLRS